MSSHLRILVVGLGKVAIGYDYPSTNFAPKSHILSLLDYAEKNFLSIEFHCIDPNPVAREFASTRLKNLFIYSNIDELPAITFEIVLNCTPIEIAARITGEIIEKVHFDLLVLEKPSANTNSEIDFINSLQSREIDFFIVYSRRALESTRVLQNLVKAYPGEKWEVNIDFSGSFKNIGVHFLDLTEHIFGDLTHFEYSDPVFRGSNSRLSKIVAKRVGNTNQNDHRISFLGPVKIDYSYGGAQISMIDERGETTRIDSDIDFQILRTVESYMNYFLYRKLTSFSKYISSAIGYIVSESKGI